MAIGIVVLDNGKLESLTELVHRQEILAIQNIPFPSEAERVKYMTECGSNRQKVTTLSNAAASFQQEFEGNMVKSRIAGDIVDYVNVSCNIAFQAVRNYMLRIDYLEKVKSLTDTLMKDLRDVAESDKEGVEELAERAAESKHGASEVARQFRDPGTLPFANRWKQQGLTYEELMDSYSKLMYSNKPFRLLTDPQKFEVFQKIIMDAGGSKLVAKNLMTAVGAAGVAVMIFMAGIMVWEIFASPYPMETAIKTAVLSAAAIGATAIGNITGAAVAAMVGITGTFATAAGFITGFVGAFIVGLTVGMLLDSLFNNGGPISTEGHVAYVAEMPDGLAIARRLVH